MAIVHRGSKGFVYVARIPAGRFAGRIKVGFTGDVHRRLRQLDAELITCAPGSFIQEQYLIRLCREHRDPKNLPQGREWFRPDVLPLLEAAWERMFGVYTPMSDAVAA